MIAARQIAFGRGGKKEEQPAYWWLCFTAEGAWSAVAMRAAGSAPAVTLETSYDGEIWEPFYVGKTTISLTKVGDKVYFRAGPGGNTKFADGEYSYNYFSMMGVVAASGNIMSLLDGENMTDALTESYCYYNMFKGCTSLVNAPELPATTLATYCYNYMFNGCTSLVNAPELPATTLATYCYRYMFDGCTSLVNAPELPATTLALYCYQYMFNGCTSLVNAPELPATTLADYCYQYMFNGCTSLVNAPELPATTLALYCYQYMFNGCTSLVNAPELPATTMKRLCYSNMFKGCEKVSLISTRQTSFNGCTNWLSGVAQSGIFYCPTSLGMDETITRGESACPEGWTVINKD